MDRPVTIALLWHSMNSENLGVGALTVSNIALLRRAAAEAGRSVRFLVVGWRDPMPDYEVLEDVEIVRLRTRYLASPGGPFTDAIRRADLVFDIGGGDSFTDIYGARRFWTVTGSKLRVLAARRPLVLSPQTIGPFEQWWARKVAKLAMNRARAVVTRDAQSIEFTDKMGIRSERIEATDVAMGLPYTKAEHPPGGPLRVGLNVSGLLWNGGYTRGNQFGLGVDYAALMRRVAAYFSDMEGVELHLVSHVLTDLLPIEDDRRAAAALHGEFPRSVLAPEFGSPSAAKSYISGLDFFMGARMHAAIAAFSSGVPVIPLAYSRKFQGVFGTLGYDHTADCRKDSADEIMTRIQDGFANRAALADDIARAMTSVDERLAAYVALSARLIGSV